MSSFLGGGGGSSGGRTILTMDTNYYVATTGNDSNPGTLAQPWATLQHAMDFISASIDIAGFTITVNIGAGSFAGLGLKSMVGGGRILFQGAGSASTTITAGPNDGVFNFGECVATNVFQLETSIALNGVTLNQDLSLSAQGVIDIFQPTRLYLGNSIGLFSDIIFKTTNDNSSAGYIYFNGGSGIGVFGTITIDTNGDTLGYAIWLEGGATCNFGGIVNSGTANTYAQAFIVIDTASNGQLGSVTGAFNGPARSVVENSSYRSTASFSGSTSDLIDSSSSLNGQQGPLPGIDTQTSGYTLAITDTLEIVEMNDALANTLTVPTNASVAFEIGTKIWITQIGAGVTTIAGAGGVTVHNAGALTQWQTAKLYKRGTDEWVQTNA